MSIKTVALLHPGNMGVTIGAAAATSGARVIWASHGRSAATEKRAKQAGLADVGTLATAVRESDLVFSICGASKLPPVLKESLAGELFARIQDRDTKALLATYCSKRRSVGQVIFWQGLGGCLSCSWDDYNAIKRAIVAAWDRS